MKRASRLSALAVIASLTFSGLTAPNAFAASDSQADPAPANNAQNAPAAPANDALKDAKQAATEAADAVLASAKELTNLAQTKEQTVEVKEAVGKIEPIRSAVEQLKGQIEAKN